MAVEYRERILSLARVAPIQPSHVAKALATNTIMAGAMLSELASKGVLRISHLKVGGSPLYYAPGNESQLDSFIRVLNEKDQKTCNLLKQEGILRDAAVDPLTRVSLRQVKDFATPLEVTHDGGKELFWKWYALPANDAETRIRGMLSLERPAPAAEPEKLPEPVAAAELPRPAESHQERLAPIEAAAEPAKPKWKRAPRKSTPRDPTADPAYKKAAAFFERHTMRVLDHRMLRKSVHDFTVELETPLGRSACHCRMVGKARLNDADLGDAYAEGQVRRLQTVVLTAGQLTKAAQERLPALKGLSVKQL